MNAETRQCQNCKSPFVIEPDDFAFYGEIKVPPPTWCPECRLVRRMIFMNERTLYKRTCDLCGKTCVSSFSKEIPTPVYCYSCWWSDKWSPLDYGMDVDFSKPFLLQLRELMRKIPWQTLLGNVPTIVGTEYFNICSYVKNSYLLYNSDYDEDSMYSTYLERSKNTLDVYMGDLCERCYESANLSKCFNVRFSNNCNDCINVAFSRNLVGCSDCFGCVNLRNKNHFIFNEPYSKEEYEKKIADFDVGSLRVVKGMKGRVAELFLSYPRKYMEGLNNVNVSGNYIFNSKNAHKSYEVGSAEDCKYCQLITCGYMGPIKDSRDIIMWGGNQTRGYECVACGGGQNNVRFSYYCWGESTMNLEYCLFTRSNSSDLFGCVGMRGKQHCILNKQYTKEEYEELIPRIVKHMKDMPYVDKKGGVYKYGEFLPPELSFFGYNETLAQEYYPLTKDIALENGYEWRDRESRNYNVTLSPGNLPDNIKYIDDAILGEVIGCAHEGRCSHQCTDAFKIVPQELELYRLMHLPLPELCPNCRHAERLGRRDPLKLWHRACQCAGAKSDNGIYSNAAGHFHGAGHCSNEFETSYAPERKEIVYCEQCYQAEVA